MILSEKYVVDNDRIFDVSVVVSPDEEIKDGFFTELQWNELSTPENTLQMESTKSLFNRQTWQQSEQHLATILYQLFSLDDPDQVAQIYLFKF